MADEDQDTTTDTNEDIAFDFRRVTSNAYAFVKARESVQSFSSFSFEDAMDAQIERIEGKDTDVRPNELNRIEKIKNDLTAAAKQIKDLPPELFNKADEETNVNTAPEGEDDS